MNFALALWVLCFCFGFCVSVVNLCFYFDFCVSVVGFVFLFDFCVCVVGFVFLFSLLCLCCRNCVSVLFLSATVSYKPGDTHKNVVSI